MSRDWLVAKALRAPEGDFRDWGAIRDWARVVGGELSEHDVRPGE